MRGKGVPKRLSRFSKKPSALQGSPTSGESGQRSSRFIFLGKGFLLLESGERRPRRRLIFLGKGLLLLAFFALCALALEVWDRYYIVTPATFWLPPEIAAGPVAIAVFVMLGLVLRAFSVIGNAVLRGYYGVLFTFYTALFAIAWVQCELAKNTMTQKAGMLTALAVSPNRMHIGPQIGELTQMQVTEPPSWFDATQIIYASFAPDRLETLSRGATEAQEFALGILKTNTNWFGLNLQDADFSRMAITDARWMGMSLASCYFRNTKFFGGDLRATTHKNARYLSVNMFNTNLRYSSFAGVKLTAHTLSEFFFGRLTTYFGPLHHGISKCDFTWGDLKGAWFQSVAIIDTNFFQANLEEVRFGDVDLYGANFAEANFERAEFDGTTVFGRFYGITRRVLLDDASDEYEYGPSLSEIDLDITTQLIKAEISPSDVYEQLEKKLAAVSPVMLKNFQSMKVTSEHVATKTPGGENSFDDALLINADMQRFCIAGIFSDCTIYINDETTDPDVLRYCADRLSRAATLYGSRLPKHLAALMENEYPYLFIEKTAMHRLALFKKWHKEVNKTFREKLRNGEAKAE